MHRCPGRICITGTGKSADVGQKIAGTLNSTGTRAYVLDATRAVHGDLGMVHHDDVVLALSQSGETEEIVKVLPSLRQLALGLIASPSSQSTLAKAADVPLILGPLEEVCPLGLAPSTSTTAMIAVVGLIGLVFGFWIIFSALIEPVQRLAEPEAHRGPARHGGRARRSGRIRHRRER